MPTLQEVKAQIKALPHKYIFYTKREIKYLPKILSDDEKILALTSGYFGTSTVLLVCTSRRLIFVDKGMFLGIKVKQLNLDRIQSIESSYIIAFGSIRIWDGAAAYEISMVLQSSIDPFVKTVRDAIDNYRRVVYRDVSGEIKRTSREALASPPMEDMTAPPPPPPPAEMSKPRTAPAPQSAMQPVDSIGQLERLAKLRDQGHLTEQEFLQQKQKILNS